mgnify:CR=1 FL=1
MTATPSSRHRAPRSSASSGLDPHRKLRYRASPIKRRRRTKEELQSLLDSTLEILSEYQERITVRHLFYRLVSAGLIEKTEAANKLLDYHLVKWREAKAIPWDVFSDGLRVRHGHETYDTLEAAISDLELHYRLN